MPFTYRVRSTEQWDKRANQTGSDFEGWLKEEYRLYTPAKGENHVRILPPSPAWKDANHYGIDVSVHYQVGPDKASVICLFKMLAKPCPICEARVRAEKARDEDQARELRVAKRVLAFILNRKDENQGVLAWGMPYTIDREISKSSRDRTTGAYFVIDHPEEGYDIYFDKDGEGINTKYSGVNLARRSSSINPKVLDWLETHALPDALRWRDYDEVKRLFEGAGRGEATTNDRDDRANHLAAFESATDRRRDDAPPERTPEQVVAAPPRVEPETPRPISRPNNGGDRQSNGDVPPPEKRADDELPFDRDPPKEQPAADGRARAAELRAKFTS
jgi:hypothetical protein